MPEHYVGTGSIQELRGILQREKARKILLATEHRAYEKSGAKEKIEPLLSSFEVQRFTDIASNPNLEQIEKGMEQLHAFGPDLVIALGGGSVMDTAKAFTVLAFQEGDPASYVRRGRAIKKQGRPLVAIPTTAGTGAEATHFAVVYIGKTKHSLSHPFVLPKYALVDPQFSFSLPPRITAETGMDALSQAIEAFWSMQATSESREYSRESIKLLFLNLVGAVKNPTPQAREAMAKGAYLSGKAINIAKTTACHALSYPFTAHYGIAHGHAVALTLPRMILYNARAMEKKALAELLSFLGAKTPQEAAEKIHSMMKEIGLEIRLFELGIADIERIQELVIGEVNIERLENNPRKLNDSDIRSVIQAIF